MAARTTALDSYKKAVREAAQKFGKENRLDTEVVNDFLFKVGIEGIKQKVSGVITVNLSVEFETTIDSDAAVDAIYERLNISGITCDDSEIKNLQLVHWAAVDMCDVQVSESE